MKKVESLRLTYENDVTEPKSLMKQFSKFSLISWGWREINCCYYHLCVQADLGTIKFQPSWVLLCEMKVGIQLLSDFQARWNVLLFCCIYFFNGLYFFSGRATQCLILYQKKNGNFFQSFSTLKSVSHPAAWFASVYVIVTLCQLLFFITKRLQRKE